MSDLTTIAEQLQFAIDTGTLGVAGERFGRGIVETMAAEPPTVDQIAVAAMQGLAADSEFGDHLRTPEAYPPFVAKRAYEMADALVAEREARKTKKGSAP